MPAVRSLFVRVYVDLAPCAGGAALSDNYGEFTPERLALLACARAWVAETPDAARMDTVSRVAAEIRAAEERGRRRGVEELRTLATEKAKEAEEAAHVEGWHGDAQMQAYHAGRRTAYASIIDAVLAPRDSGKETKCLLCYGRHKTDDCPGDRK